MTTPELLRNNEPQRVLAGEYIHLHPNFNQVVEENEDFITFSLGDFEVSGVCKISVVGLRQKDLVTLPPRYPSLPTVPSIEMRYILTNEGIEPVLESIPIILEVITERLPLDKIEQIKCTAIVKGKIYNGEQSYDEVALDQDGTTSVTFVTFMDPETEEPNEFFYPATPEAFATTQIVISN